MNISLCDVILLTGEQTGSAQTSIISIFDFILQTGEQTLVYVTSYDELEK